jgi:hypothetical protein
VQHQDALDDHDVGRLDLAHLVGAAAVRDEIVHGDLDGAAGF